MCLNSILRQSLTTASGRYCCKSPQSAGDDFPAAEGFNRRPSICVVSIGLPRSLVSLSSGYEVPHIFTRNSRLRPGEFWATSAKGLLQQNLPRAVSCTAASPHSITSSAKVRSLGGISIPSAFEVLRLITNSNLVGCITGRSFGLIPFRILPV